MPIKRKDGTLFGVLFAIDPEEQPASCADELPLINVLVSLLGTILEHEMAAADQARLVERERALSLRDSLTNLYNRRGWDVLATAEEARCRRYGHPACVVSIDLDSLKSTNDTDGHAAGDQLLRLAANAIRSVVREVDVVARVGGDEFLILLVECNVGGGEAFFERVEKSFQSVNVQASCGLATFNPVDGLVACVDEADRAMYAQKRQHRATPVAAGFYL